MRKITLSHNTFDGELDLEETYLDLDKIELCAVESIAHTSKNEEVFDLVVQDNPNYATNLSLVHNGGGKRKGSFAIYLNPTHPDILDFLELRKNNGKEELRARDLNLALWVPDLFFKKVEADEDWHLMDPSVCSGLDDVYDEREDGGSFTDLYNKYVSENKFVKTVKARDVWAAMLQSQIETGQPYIMAKDSCNRKSNQKNLGTIKSSNLCTEIIEYSSAEETAVCNLASLSLPACVEGKKGKRTFNFSKLEESVKTLTENLDKIISIEYYPVETAKRSNLRHRPIGLGIQGLADVFAMLRLSWESEAAKKLNKDIAETIYYAAMKTSCDLAKKNGAYETFQGSPLSQGLFQFDLWNVSPSDRYDWESLRKDVKKYGARNSLLVAPMPTASTSQILGNTECFEPITSNIYKRATLSGEFIQVNKYLVDDLMELGIWNENMRQKIIASNGSVQNIAEIPENIKEIYKTVWEIPQRIIVDFAADRGAFIDQTQSLNTTLTTNTWHFIGFSQDEASITYVVDGVVYSVTGTGGIFYGDGSPMRLNYDEYTSGNQGDLYVRDFKVIEQYPANSTMLLNIYNSQKANYGY